MNWQELQSDISNWATKNFGDGPAWQPMLGLVEEVGEFYSSRSAHDRADALGDQCIYALNLCEKVGVDFRDITGVGELRVPMGELLVSLGECCRAVLKHSQGIRGYSHEVRLGKMRCSLRVWYLWATWEARTYGLPDLLTTTRKVWAEVRKRDWVRDPFAAVGV